MKRAALALIVLALTACSGTPPRTSLQKVTRVQTVTRHGPPIPQATGTVRRSPYAPAQEDISKRGNYTRGGLYAPEIQDSAPDGLPDVDQIPEPQVRAEPRSLYGNRSPYAVLGQTYSIIDNPTSYDEVGLASYYGNKFHGRRTSNLEVYDMYAFSAAHKTLPLPSYARVTNLANGKSVVVRVNDRGPFHEGRIIDLSYAAAVKLGVDRVGTARVEVKGLSPGEDARESGSVLADRTTAAPTVMQPQLVLPAGVRIATGRPLAAAATSAAPASAIDGLLAALPIASANASERRRQAATASNAADLAPPTPNAGGERFDMQQNGRTMTADQFDAWMRARRMRVATGKSGAVDASASAVTTVPTTPAPSATAVVVPPPQQLSSVAAGDAITLQVASFAAHANAEHALALLTGAGIGSARLLDADANGRAVWRLRVGPVDPAHAQELIARIQGLGFGQPQRVRE
ncbi:MAG: septal ring lytic transglycosylase RlpA family protein [Xanthomonadaceae bacterium]|nr:septal ring lytic transglycosylase RlpA family protein [Xanthomonadaceae bacterium]